MGNLKVSVILSAYNAEKYIGQAIQSILDQTYKNFELIIFDDGSIDNTKKIISEYSNKNKRIIPIFNKKNIGYQGFIKNLNQGIKLSKGKYIARMDADDISLPNRLEKQVNFLEKNKDVFLVGGMAVHINDNNKKIGVSKIPFEHDLLKKDLSMYNPIYHPTIMFRNEKIFNYREKIFYAEDYDAFLILDSKCKKLANLNEYLIKYRILNSSISRSKRVQQALFMRKAQEFYKQRISDGVDEYDDFDPKDFLEIDVFEKKSDKNLLIFAIKNSLKYYDDLVFYSKKLIKYYGYSNFILIFYLITFIGKNNFYKLIKFIQKLKSIFGFYR